MWFLVTVLLLYLFTQNWFLTFFYLLIFFPWILLLWAVVYIFLHIKNDIH